jgi:PAS domain S-box-containing protein
VLEFVIEAMVDAVLVIDADGRITLANAGATQLTSYASDELRGMHVQRLFIDDNSGLRTLVRRRIEDGAVLRREESWLVTKQGEHIPVSVTGSPVVNDEGTLHGIVLVARDVREMRQLLADKEAEIARRRAVEDELRAVNASIEDKLEQTRTQLLLAERLATLGTLAGGFGHELRSIAQVQIMAIDEIASALTADKLVIETVRQRLPELDRVYHHIAEHGERLLHLARPGPDHVDAIDLSAIVRDVAAMLRLAGKLLRVELDLALPPEPVKVTVNRTRIEQILVNLIVNAVDALGGNGTVTIDVRRDDETGRVVCEVRDTGSGIPAEHLERIFEPFYTTKGEQGTGLGLPVVREIVTSYGGQLGVKSTPGQGTTFRFDLPGG